MGTKFCAKLQMAPLKFHTKFWTHTPQRRHFTEFHFCLRFMIYLNCDVIKDKHYNDVIRTAIASPITSLTIIYSTVYKRRSKKTSKLRVTGLCEGNPLVTGEFPAPRASDAGMFPFVDVILVNWVLYHGVRTRVSGWHDITASDLTLIQGHTPLAHCKGIVNNDGQNRAWS